MGNEEVLKEKLGQALDLENTKMNELKIAARKSTQKADWDYILAKFRNDLTQVIVNNRKVSSENSPQTGKCQSSQVL